MGAGGGGFLMLYAPENHDKLTEALHAQGLRRTFFRFDFEGAKVVANMKSTNFLSRQQ
jgi:galactokinase/mevalonate kinase-like predicted kinase